MHYDILSVLHYICEYSYFHYLRQCIALELISYLHLVCKVGFYYCLIQAWEVEETLNSGGGGIHNIKYFIYTLTLSIMLNSWNCSHIVIFNNSHRACQYCVVSLYFLATEKISRSFLARRSCQLSFPCSSTHHTPVCITMWRLQAFAWGLSGTGNCISPCLKNIICFLFSPPHENNLCRI